jgi:L-asparaginase II
MSMRGMAKAFYNLAKSTDPVHQKVVDACLAHPEMVAGIGRTDTELMQEIRGLFLKVGAEGVQVAFTKDGRTVVFKVSDGSDRAHSVILQDAFAKMNFAIDIKHPEVFGAGKVVGEIRAAK